MSEGHRSAQRINRGLTGDPYLLRDDQHPADENQGRGLDHLNHQRTASDAMASALDQTAVAIRLFRFYRRSGLPFIPAITKAVRAARRGF